MIIPLVMGSMSGAGIGWLSAALSAWKAETVPERRIWIRVALIVCVGWILLVFVPGALAVAGLVAQWAYWTAFAAYFGGFTLLMLWTRSRLRPIRGSHGGLRSP